MKIEKMTIANAFVLTTVTSWILCSAFVFLLPALSMTLTGWWLHGLDLSPPGSFKLELTNFLFGGATLILAFRLIGYIFGWTWEFFSKN